MTTEPLEEELEYYKQTKVGLTPVESEIIDIFPVGTPYSIKDLMKLLPNKNYHIIYNAVRSLEDKEYIRYLETKNRIKFYTRDIHNVTTDLDTNPLLSLINNYKSLFENVPSGPHTETTSKIARIPYDVARLFFYANQFQNDHALPVVGKLPLLTDKELRTKWVDIRGNLEETVDQIEGVLSSAKAILKLITTKGDFNEYKRVFQVNEEDLPAINSTIDWYMTEYKRTDND